MPLDPMLITGAIDAVASLVQTLISHLDKSPEDRRLLALQDANANLTDLQASLELLIQTIQEPPKA